MAFVVATRPGTCMKTMCQTLPATLPIRSSLSLAQTVHSVPPGNYAAPRPSTRSFNYINRDVTSKFTIGFRSDLLNDMKGQRAGIAGKYTENTFYLARYFGTTVMFRSELRFDHSWDP